jgi:hypothetical protein
VDLVTLALNLHTQGIDPGLNFGDINAIRDVYERTTRCACPNGSPMSEIWFSPPFPAPIRTPSTRGSII